MCQPCTGFFSEDWSCVGPGMNLKIKQKRNLFTDFSLFLDSKDGPWQLQLHFVFYRTAYLSTDFLRSLSPCQDHIYFMIRPETCFQQEQAQQQQILSHRYQEKKCLQNLSQE